MEYGTEPVAPEAPPAADSASKMIERQAPTIDPSEAALAKLWQTRVKADKQHWDKRFKKMRENQKYVRRGADEAWVLAGNYTVPVIRRHINTSVAALYARNPTVVAKRRARLLYKLWDGKAESLMQAVQVVQTLGPDVAPIMAPNEWALVQEVQQAQSTNRMLNTVAKTAAALVQYFFNEQEPNFKVQMKGAVRRAKTCGVAYVVLGFQRSLAMRPDIRAQLTDVTQQIAYAERLLADLHDGVIPEGSAELAELKTTLAALQAEPMMLVREGVVFDFPRATEIIPDQKTRMLRGWVGARYLTREFHLSSNRVKEIYKKDLGASTYTKYAGGGPTASPGEKAEDGEVCVWLIQDKETRTVFTIADGYPGFLQPPAPHDVKVERFFNIYALTFDEIEDEEDPFPESDVDAMRDAQDEYNRSREGLREHRIAARPAYASAKGRLDEPDRLKLAHHAAHQVIELNALAPGEKIGDLVQRLDKAAIDPALYETESAFQDMLRSVGSDATDIGGAEPDVTATQTSVTEGKRNTEKGSAVDDLDEVLTDIARGTAQVCFAEIDPETATKICGPGAVWPQLSREQIAEEVFIEIKAGSSGRPNAAAELAKLERATPLLVQVPGIGPKVVAEKLADLLELDIEDFYVEGLPSLVAMNAMAGKQAQIGSGDPATDPNGQGGQGGDNAQRGAEPTPGPQGAFPT